MAFGYSTSRTIAAATANATLVKAAPGIVNGWQITNAAAYPVFLKLYDAVAAPTAGAGTIKMTIGVPAATSVFADFGPNGIFFATGIGFTITKLVADADATVLVASDCVLNLFYS